MSVINIIKIIVQVEVKLNDQPFIFEFQTINPNRYDDFDIY